MCACCGLPCLHATKSMQPYCCCCGLLGICHCAISPALPSLVLQRLLGKFWHQRQHIVGICIVFYVFTLSAQMTSSRRVTLSAVVISTVVTSAEILPKAERCTYFILLRDALFCDVKLLQRRRLRSNLAPPCQRGAHKGTGICFYLLITFLIVKIHISMYKIIVADLRLTPPRHLGEVPT